MQSAKKPLIYLASPHSHKDEVVREIRYQQVMQVWKILFTRGLLVFSPIMHTHPAKLSKKPDFSMFEEFDTRMIDVCDEVWVVCLAGWKESKGVMAEIEYALRSRKRIVYVEVRQGEYGEVEDFRVLTLTQIFPYILYRHNRNQFMHYDDLEAERHSTTKQQEYIQLLGWKKLRYTEAVLEHKMAEILGKGQQAVYELSFNDADKVIRGLKEICKKVGVGW